jgi:hypothetical protein
MPRGGHIVLISLETPILFTIMVVPIYISINSATVHKNSLFSMPWLRVLSFDVLVIAIFTIVM